MQVMLSANISVTNGLANGTRGVVIAFDAAGWPIVKVCLGFLVTRLCAQFIDQNCISNFKSDIYRQV